MARHGTRAVRRLYEKHFAGRDYDTIDVDPAAASYGASRPGHHFVDSVEHVGATACDALVPTKHPRIDRPTTECQKLFASEAPDPGRHHVGILGDIIPESPGGFVGIRCSMACSGYGLDPQRAEKTIATCHDRLVERGMLMIGWNDLPRAP